MNHNQQTVLKDENLVDHLHAAPEDSCAINTEPLLVRLHRAFGPLVGAIILDVVDFVTLGPIGLVLGLLIGCPVGWWISSIYGFSHRARVLIAVLAGVYCTIPFTELLPLATIVSAVARFYSSPGAVIPHVASDKPDAE